MLNGNFVWLRPVVPQDATLLSRWSHDPEAHHILARRAAAMLFSQKAGHIEQAVDDCIVLAIANTDGLQIGLALAYSINQRDRWLYVDVLIASETPHATKMEAWLLLVDFVFSWYPVETLYREFPEFAAAETSLAQSIGFDEQGLLQGRLWLRDRYWSVCVLALSRERWEARRSTFVDNIAIQLSYDSTPNSDV